MRSISRAYSALFHPAHSGLGAILVLMFLGCIAFAASFKLVVPALLSLFPALGIVIVTRATLGKMAEFDSDAQRRAHHAWAMSADSPDEVRARMTSSSFPAVNVDGMPMVDGTGTDIFGRVYGDGNDDAYTYDFDRFSDDAVTGMALDTADAWSSPTGMHNND